MVNSGDIDSPGMHEAARREKLRRLTDLGIDPWGQRFDERSPIAEIRARTAEITLKLEDGREVALPNLPDPELDFRSWLAEQGKGELVGPRVRAAGRIMLQRDAGKLRFIDIQDWTGSIQIFVGYTPSKS